MRFKAADVKNMKNKKLYFGGGKVRVNEWNSHFKYCRISKYCLKMTNEEVDVLAYYQELWWWMNGFFLRMETRPELQIFVTEFAGGGQLPYGLGTVLCCFVFLSFAICFWRYLHEFLCFLELKEVARDFSGPVCLTVTTTRLCVSSQIRCGTAMKIQHSQKRKGVGSLVSGEDSVVFRQLSSPHVLRWHFLCVYAERERDRQTQRELRHLLLLL